MRRETPAVSQAWERLRERVARLRNEYRHLETPTSEDPRWRSNVSYQIDASASREEWSALCERIARESR